MYIIIPMPLNYTVKGQGKKNIVLLQGWGGSLASLQRLQDELGKSENYRIFNVEWPGFGESAFPTNKAFTIEEYVSALELFLTNNGLEKPILVGHSFGGKVAMAYAIKNADRVGSLILINSSGLKPQNTLKRYALWLPTKIFGGILSLPLLKRIKNPIRRGYYKLIVREHDYLTSETLQATLKNILKVNLDKDVHKIGVDTLLIWGEKDKYTPLWMGQKLSTLIPNSRLEVIKDAKHNLPLINPSIVASMIRLYIK